MGRQRAPDGGWAWAVLVGAHASTVLGPGYLATLGVFYIEWKNHFDVTASDASWLVASPWFVASPVCFISGAVAERVGIRRVAMTGAVLAGLGTILGSRASTIYQLYVFNGMTGVGAVMTLSPGSILISKYFKKRYVLANGLAVLGLNVGHIVFAPLMRLLIAHFGWRGAMFIIGALQMNGVAACALFRPLNASPREAAASKLADISGRSGPYNNNPNKPRSIWQKHFKFLHVFANLRVTLLFIMIGFYSMATITNLVHLPARSREAGWSDDRSAMLLFVYGVVSLVTRSTHGWFVDRNYVGSFKLLIVALLGVTVTAFLNPASDSYVFLVGYAVVLGSFIGVVTPLLTVSMKAVTAARDAPAALSLVWASILLFNGVGSIIAGELYDVTGNYVATFLASGAMFLLALLIFAVVMVMQTRRERSRVAGGTRELTRVRYQPTAEDNGECAV